MGLGTWGIIIPLPTVLTGIRPITLSWGMLSGVLERPMMNSVTAEIRYYCIVTRCLTVYRRV